LTLRRDITREWNTARRPLGDNADHSTVIKPNGFNTTRRRTVIGGGSLRTTLWLFSGATTQRKRNTEKYCPGN
jgi:hypothetical protein